VQREKHRARRNRTDSEREFITPFGGFKRVTALARKEFVIEFLNKFSHHRYSTIQDADVECTID
jgi:hypothetical protein